METVTSRFGPNFIRVGRKFYLSQWKNINQRKWTAMTSTKVDYKPQTRLRARPKPLSYIGHILHLFLRFPEREIWSYDGLFCTLNLLKYVNLTVEHAIYLHGGDKGLVKHINYAHVNDLPNDHHACLEWARIFSLGECHFAPVIKVSWRALI